MVDIVFKSNANMTFIIEKTNKEIEIKGCKEINRIDDKDWADLLEEQREFIEKRIYSDKNPDGCFFVAKDPIMPKKLKEIGEPKADGFMKEEELHGKILTAEQVKEMIKKQPKVKKKSKTKK